MPVEAIIVAGALCGGFVTGLSGFGTGLTALGVWLYVLDPATAAALVVTCSVIGQVQSLCSVRRAVSWTRLWPFLIGGAAGVPLGVMARCAWWMRRRSRGCPASFWSAMPA